MSTFEHTHTGRLTKGELAHHILRDHPEHVHPVGKELLRWTAEELVTHHREMHTARSTPTSQNA